MKIALAGILAVLAATLILAACGERDRNASDDAPRTQAATLPSVPESLNLQAGDSCRMSAGGGVPASNNELRVPSRAPDIRGLITEVERLPFDSTGRRIRVVARPDSPDGPDAFVTVRGATPVAQRVGHRATASLLTLCQEVSVWFDGPVRESRPPQGDAEAVVIEAIRELSRVTRTR